MGLFSRKSEPVDPAALAEYAAEARRLRQERSPMSRDPGAHAENHHGWAVQDNVEDR